MRRAVILALLLLGMRLVLPLGSEAESPQSLLVFGFLILAAHTVGELAVALRLPKIVGYLAAGVLFGPDALGAVSAVAVSDLGPVSRLAVALIAFLAGAELRWAEVRERGTAILKIMSTELALCFAVLFAMLWLMRDLAPFLSGGTQREMLAFSLLFAVIAIVHSPAVTMALLTETGARGPVARTTLGVVLLSDVAVVLLFSGALALARALAPAPGSEAGISVGMLIWEIVGAMVVGVLLGGAVSLYLRFVRRELLMFGVVVAFFGAEVARMAHVETLLTLLVAGFVTENLDSRRGEELRHALERAAAPVFVVFFALAGAGMRLGEVAAFWPLVIPIAIVRALAIWAGTRIGARWARVTGPVARDTWLGLISQAGVAIGLASVVAQAYPGRGAQLSTFFLAVMALNQIAGPILFRWALSRSGELSDEAPADSREPATAR